MLHTICMGVLLTQVEYIPPLQLERRTRLQEPVEPELRRRVHLGAQLLVHIFLVKAQLVQHAHQEPVMVNTRVRYYEKKRGNCVLNILKNN